MTASSTRPYMIRAIYEWCNDNGFTPYIAVSVDERTLVPREHVRAGEIVLNLSASATNNLTLGNDLVHFHARFSGVVRELSIPVENITAIYARENGHGMAFEVPKPLAETSSPKPARTNVEETSAAATKTEQGNAPIKNSPITNAPISGAVPASPTPGSALKTASVTKLPEPARKSVRGKTITQVVEAVVTPKDKARGSSDAKTPTLSAVDDTTDPNDEPAGPGQQNGSRSGARGRAKLTRIK